MPSFTVTFIREKDQARYDTRTCEPQLNLLAHAQIIELEIGSSCGGHGICGGDRICISPSQKRYFSAPTEEERRHLSAAEIDAGWRLACQCFPEPKDDSQELLASFRG